MHMGLQGIYKVKLEMGYTQSEFFALFAYKLQPKTPAKSTKEAKPGDDQPPITALPEPEGKGLDAIKARMLELLQRGEPVYPDANLYGRENGPRAPPEFWYHPEGEAQAILRIYRFMFKNPDNPEQLEPNPDQIDLVLGLHGFVVAFAAKNGGDKDIVKGLGFRGLKVEKDRSY